MANDELLRVGIALCKDPPLAVKCEVEQQWQDSVYVVCANDTAAEAAMLDLCVVPWCPGAIARELGKTSSISDLRMNEARRTFREKTVRAGRSEKLGTYCEVDRYQ